MGDWNQTCGLSRLAIKEENKIAILILKQNCKDNIYGNGFCDSNDLYKPVTFAIRATYSNYGQIKDVEDNSLIKSYLNKIVEYKFEEITENTLINNEYLDKIIYNPLEIQEFDFSIEEIVNNLINFGDLPGISCMMFHRNLYYELINQVGNRVLYNKNITYRNFLSECFINNPEIIQIKLNQINYESFQGLIEVLNQSNKLDKVKEDLIDLIIFDRAMHLSRMFYSPQVGVGSQTEEYEINRIISSFIIDSSEEIFRNKLNNGEDVIRKEVFETTLFD